HANSLSSDREALAAAAAAFGVGVFEDEAGGEIVLLPVHGRADQIEDRAAVDEEGAGRGLDPLVEGHGLADIVDGISQARAAAAGGGELDPERSLRRTRHQRGNPRLRGGGEGERGRARAAGGGGLRHHSIPSSSLASSVIFCGSQGGSQTSSTSASPTPGTAPTRSSTSPGIDSATGQCGVVRVILTRAWCSGVISTS